jgi:ankyrin repeat protein
MGTFFKYAAAGLVAFSFASAAPNSDVADAAMRGDKSAVQTLLQQKADVNAKQVDGTSPLHCAVESNDLQLTDLLLRAGAKPAAANEAGATPLLLATQNGNAAIIERLLAAGADPNSPLTKTGDTALMMASRTGKVDAVKALLDHPGPGKCERDLGWHHRPDVGYFGTASGRCEDAYRTRCRRKRAIVLRTLRFGPRV